MERLPLSKKEEQIVSDAKKEYVRGDVGIKLVEGERRLYRELRR